MLEVSGGVSVAGADGVSVMNPEAPPPGSGAPASRTNPNLTSAPTSGVYTAQRPAANRRSDRAKESSRLERAHRFGRPVRLHRDACRGRGVSPDRACVCPCAWPPFAAALFCGLRSVLVGRSWVPAGSSHPVPAGVLAAFLALAPLGAAAGEAERMARQLADMVNNSSEHVRCTPHPETLSIVCVAEGADQDGAERLAAYLAHLIEEHTDGVLEGWTLIVSPVGE